MIIENGMVFGVGGKFHKTSLYSVGGKVVKGEDAPGTVCRTASRILDAAGFYVIPGLVDVHAHGAVGHDFCDGDMEGLRKIAEYEYRSGVTSFCPTSMTLPEARLAEIYAAVPMLLREMESVGGGERVSKEKAAEAVNLSRIVGIHMEGPFLATKKCGAQNPKDIVPADYDMFCRLNEAGGGLLKIVTVAPEQARNLEFIRRVSGEVNVSLGHSTAGFEEAEAGFAAGANHVTHLFNAMNPYHHRNPGIIGAATGQKDVFVELISDGMHVHPAAVRDVFRLFGDGRVVLISDSTASCGMPDGEYVLGGQAVLKDGRKVTLAASGGMKRLGVAGLPDVPNGKAVPGGGNLSGMAEAPNPSDEVIAGSASNLYECMCCAVSFGVPLESAVKAATVNPARSIGLEGQIGSFVPGAWADCLLMDETLRLRAVISNEHVTWLS